MLVKGHPGTHDISITKQSTTKSCAYLMRYTVLGILIAISLMVNDMISSWSFNRRSTVIYGCISMKTEGHHVDRNNLHCHHKGMSHGQSLREQICWHSLIKWNRSQLSKNQVSVDCFLKWRPLCLWSQCVNLSHQQCHQIDKLMRLMDSGQTAQIYCITIDFLSN